MSEKAKTLLTLLTMTIAIIAGLFWLAKSSDDRDAKDRATMSSGSAYTKGVITKIFYYKGKTVGVKYMVGSVIYEESHGWDKNPKHLNKGDSIYIRYSTQNPKVFFTELEKDY